MNMVPSKMNTVVRKLDLIVCKTWSRILVTSKRFARREPHRKPMWMPMAPSKLFVIKKKPVIPEDEAKQIEFLEQRHEIFMDSIRAYFKNEFYSPLISLGGMSEEVVKAEEEEQERLLRENDEENRKIAALRDEHRALEQKMAEERLVKENFNLEMRKEEEIRKASELVKQELKRSDTYISKAKLEEAIEAALSNPTHYEYAIDLGGRVYFDNKLHPYALKPFAVPETSNVTEEFEETPNPLQLEKKVLY